MWKSLKGGREHFILAGMPSVLESQMGYAFRDAALLELALTHPSRGHERKRRAPHNERLEFLGDAVLELVISEHLYRLFPDVAEGRLTKVRSHLVSRPALVELAAALNVGAHLLLGKAEESHGGRHRASNLANVMEAVIGAIFLDGGYDAARAFVIRLVEPRLGEVGDNPEPTNAKGLLQEKLHAIGEQAVYRIMSETGPSHRRQFEAAVEVRGKVLGSGAGTTKKEAETRAATAALAVLSTSGSGSAAS